MAVTEQQVSESRNIIGALVRVAGPMIEAGGMLGDHTHPFEAKALILSGDIRIATAASERVYQAGDVFHLAAEEPHSEFYGMLGVQYLVGRKTPAAA